MIAWIVETLVASALLMGAVLLARAPIRRLFGARAAYALWLLPALRMILPPLPGHRALFVPVAVFRPEAATIGLVDPATAMRLGPPPGGGLLPPVPAPLLDPVPPPALHLPALLLALWLGVAALVFMGALLRYRRFLRDALARAVPLAVECGVEVMASPAVPGPVATGIWRRRILLPADFLARYAPEERRLALLHEGAHHDRLDLVANLAALAVRALHWWNPLAIAAHRAFRADQELACDETVLADRANDRAAYAGALLKSAVARTPAMACALNAKDQLKQRMRMAAHAPVGRVRLGLGAAVAVTAIAAGTVATASGLPEAPVVLVAPPAPVAVAPVIVGPASVERLALSDQARRAEARARLASREAEAQARLAERAARRAEPEAADADAIVQDRLQATRDRMAAACAGRGTPVARTDDFATLALCGRDVPAIVRASLGRARADIARNSGFGERQRAEALADLDAAIARETR